MEQYKKMDRSKLLLSPSGGKYQTRVGFGAVTSIDNEDIASEYNPNTQKSISRKSAYEQSVRSTLNDSVVSQPVRG